MTIHPLPPDHLSREQKTAALKALDVAVEMFHLAATGPDDVEVSVRVYALPGDAAAKDWRSIELPDVPEAEDPQQLVGFVLQDARWDIWLRAGQSPAQMAATVGHEARHLWQRLHFRKGVMVEEDAEAFGLLVAERAGWPTP